MSRTIKPRYFEQILVASGSGEFPLDMLRYDSCCPRTEADSHLIDSEHRERRHVVLRRFCLELKPPTEARWRSMGWTVRWRNDADTFDTDRERIMRDE